MSTFSRSTPGHAPPHARDRNPRILIADGDARFREALEQSLAPFPYDLSLAEDGAQAVSLVRRVEMDVVVTELTMPRLSGIDLLTLVKEASPQTEVIILTADGTLEDAISALRGRAFDFLLKPLDDVRELLLAIERALNQRSRPERPPESEAARPGAAPNLALLSARELEVVRLAGEGLGNKTIAGRLSLSEKTVRNHLSSAYQKLGVGNRTQAAVVLKHYRLG